MEELYIPVKTKSECRKVYLDDILYIVQRSRVCTIYTENYEIRFYDKLVNLDKYLTENFVRVLKYSAINFQKVEKIDNGIIYFRCGKCFKDIGIANYIKAKQLFVAYMFKAAVINDIGKMNYQTDERTKKNYSKGRMIPSEKNNPDNLLR